MIRNRRSLVILASAASLAVGVAVGGCRPKSRPQPQAQNPPAAPVHDDAYAAMSEFQRRAADLSTIAKQLPGRDPSEDRQQIAAAFDAAHDSLTLMGGANPPGSLRQQLRIIDTTRQFLRGSGGARGGTSTVSVEPSIDQGLRAVHNALGDVRQRLFPNDQNIQSQIGAFGERVGELDSVRGPLHSLVVAQGFQAASTVFDTMANELTARQQQIAQPTPAPAAPTATPAAAMTPPAAPRPPAPAAATPAPAPRPAPAAAASAAPSAPAPAAAPAGGQSPQDLQLLQQQIQQLQEQNRQLQEQLMRQQQQPAAPAPVPGSVPPPPPPPPAAR